MSLAEDGKLQATLKSTLEQCISLARKKIRSKKGITELQALLTDYSSNLELSVIILQVIRLISAYQNIKKEENEQVKDTVSLDEYANLESVLQKYESSVRQHIKNQQQLKIYCEDLEEKNRQLQKNNEQLLKNTKNSLTSLKRQNQKLMEEISLLRQKAKQNDKRDKQFTSRESKDRQQTVLNSIKKARKLIDSQNGFSARQDSSSHNWNDRIEDSSARQKRHSLSSIKQNK